MERCATYIPCSISFLLSSWIARILFMLGATGGCAPQDGLEWTSVSTCFEVERGGRGISRG